MRCVLDESSLNITIWPINILSHTHTHILTHTHTHTHTHTLSLSLSVLFRTSESVSARCSHRVSSNTHAHRRTHTLTHSCIFKYTYIYTYEPATCLYEHMYL